jgi:hypothetical protein
MAFADALSQVPDMHFEAIVQRRWHLGQPTMDRLAEAAEHAGHAGSILRASLRPPAFAGIMHV